MPLMGKNKQELQIPDKQFTSFAVVIASWLGNTLPQQRKENHGNAMECIITIM